MSPRDRAQLRARRRAQVRRRRIAALALLATLGVAGAWAAGLLSSGGDASAGGTTTTSGSTTGSTSTTTTSPPAGPPITIEWVGDMVLASSFGTPSDGGASLFDGVRGTLGKADITFGNLEETLSVGGGSKCGAGSANCYAFQAPPSYARHLRTAGFDIVNVANNHAFDFGQSGLDQTLAALRKHKVAYTGRPNQITYVERKGVRVAFVAFASYPWAARLEKIGAAAALVRKAASRADLVVVGFHGGAEGSDKTHVPIGTEWAYGENRGDLRRFSHAVIDAGADLVVGSGPHVVRGVERYKGRMVAYSSGNFLGYHNFALGGVLNMSGIVRATLRPNGSYAGGRWISVALTGPGLPSIDSSHGAAAFVAQMSRSDFGSRAPRFAADGTMR